MDTNNYISYLLCLNILTSLGHGDDDDDDDDDDEHPDKDFYDYKEGKMALPPLWMNHYCTKMTCSLKIREESAEAETRMIQTKVCDGKCERHLGMTQLST